MYCAYCGTEHDESTPFSKEHIIPQALGGPEPLTIPTCKDSNNTLGSQVDAPFMDFLPIRSKRFFLGLESAKGNAPTLDLSGNSSIGGKEVELSYAISQEGKELKIAKPIISKSVGADGREHWQILGDPAKAREVVVGLIRKRAAAGKTVSLNDGTVVTEQNVDELLGPMQETTQNPSVLKTITFDFRVPIRFFSKLALAMGHFHFGEAFSRSAHAEVLRQAMRIENIQGLKLKGAAIWPATEAVQGALQLFGKEGHHVIAIMEGPPPVMLAILFGDIGAIIPLGELPPGNVPRLSGEWAIWRVELPSRQLTKLTFYEWAAERLA